MQSVFDIEMSVADNYGAEVGENCLIVEKKFT